MQFFPADYLADTAHLSTLEHGAYLLLIMNYWQRGESFKAKDESVLNDRLAKIARLPAARWAKVKETLAEFFETSPTEWRHRRIERDLAEVREKSLLNKANGKKGAERRWPGQARAIAISDIREDKDKKEAPPYPPRPGGGAGGPKPEPSFGPRASRRPSAAPTTGFCRNGPSCGSGPPP
jgi:uncharacterized protein YdaU (DUF1376 family)